GRVAGSTLPSEARQGTHRGSAADPAAAVYRTVGDAFGAAAFFAAFAGAAFVAAAVDAAFFAVAFFAAVFFAADFFAAAVEVAFFAAFFAVLLAGRRVPPWSAVDARFSISICGACSRVTDSTLIPRRSDTLVSPSVMYGPNRPSRITTCRSVRGSVPSSRSGAAGARRPRVFGAANSASASSSVMVNSCSSLSRERVSSPRLRYGPYRPDAA